MRNSSLKLLSEWRYMLLLLRCGPVADADMTASCISPCLSGELSAAAAAAAAAAAVPAVCGSSANKRVASVPLAVILPCLTADQMQKRVGLSIERKCQRASSNAQGQPRAGVAAAKTLRSGTWPIASAATSVATRLLPRARARALPAACHCSRYHWPVILYLKVVPVPYSCSTCTVLYRSTRSS